MNEVESHYQRVSSAWQLIMGERQHFGWYSSGEESIDSASSQLVDALLQTEHITSESRILEVGCGTGGTAFYLHEKFGCQVTGIALSANEISLANDLSQQKGYASKVNFFQADGQNNPFEDETFNYVIMLESSLLIPDKDSLFSENFRVLKKGGKLLICDQVKIRDLKAAEMYKLGKQLEHLHMTFGKTHTENFDAYNSKLKRAGFVSIHTQDISEHLLPSPEKWKQAAQKNHRSVLEYFDEQQFQSFLIACDALTEFMLKKILSYGFIRAEKP